MNCFAKTKCRDTTQPRAEAHFVPGNPTHARSLLRSLSAAAAAPGPRVCICESNGDGGGAAGGVGSGLTSQAYYPISGGLATRRWYWGSEGAVLYNAVSGSQRGRKKLSGRKAPSPPLGPGHRVPGPESFPPPAVAGRFVSPASALRATREGLLPGLHREHGGRKGGRPRRDSQGPRSPAAGRAA